MTSKCGPLGIIGDDRYRTLPEARIIELLLLTGWAYEIDSPVALEAAKKVLQSWTQIGLAFRLGTNGERLFDPVEVHNFMKRAGLDGRDDFFLRTDVPNHRRLVLDLAEGGSPGSRPEGERRFEVDFRRVFSLRSISRGSKLRLRMPLPLAGDYLQDLQVTPFAETAGETQINLSSGRLEARVVASGEVEVSIGAKLSFTARPQAPCFGPGKVAPDMALYLRDREGMIVVSERIRALAQSLAGTGVPALEAVRAFWSYINDELTGGALHYDQMDIASPCDWVLDCGWFDCQMASTLLVALCRAQGIPARVLSGFLLYPKAPTNHYWAEVWIEDQGWTPFDFASWDLSWGGRDPEWRDYFFGRLDYRITVQCLPLDFTGALGVPLPPAWCIFQRSSPGGVEINFLDIGGPLVYSDTVCVTEC